MTRLAMISAVNPYPTDSGKKVVLAGLVDYFVARLGTANVHYVIIGNRPDGEFPVSVSPIETPTTRQAIGSLAFRTGTGRSSMQESFLWSRSTQTAVDDCLRELAPDIELYDTVRTGQYAGHAPGRTRICYLDDLFSQRYESMLSAGKTDRSAQFKPLGKFAEHVPTKLHFLTENRAVQRGLLTTEKTLVARSENRAARSFANCLLVNHHETHLLQRRAAVPEGRIKTIPPLIHAPTAVERRYQGAPEFLFLGLLSMPHNDDGLRAFIRQTWPRVIEKMPAARLRVVGREPLPELYRAIAEYGRGTITLEGYVPDLGVLMSESAAMVNPLRLGSGIKVKIIEALARGLPVVSSELGARGVRTGADNGVCVAEHTYEWVDQLEVLTSPAHNSQVSAAASAHFESAYSRAAVFASYDRIFNLG
jgi:glycosyltransferase involved in cell wall biosynthesis